jgi:8-oxo-dGTP diphosphatase
MAQKQLLKDFIPNLSVNCVVFGFESGKLNVVLIERKMHYWGKIYHDLELPGELVRRDEDLNSSACRVLKELTGLDNIYLKQFEAFGSPQRLKRRKRDLTWLKFVGHPEQTVVTIAYYSLINIDQGKISKYKLHPNVRWMQVSEVQELAYDHNDILTNALAVLRAELLLKPIAYELLPKKFTLGQLQNLYEVILGKSLDKRNFRKKIAKLPYIIPTAEIQANVAHKPAQFYTFNNKAYARMHKEALESAVV